jgi:hypothetical protein
MPNQALSTAEIRAIFDEEVSAAGGFVSDTFDDGTRLFARSIRSRVSEVRPKDHMQGGVAIKAADSEISVHPYLFRQVCTNGAILAHAIEARQVANSDMLPTDDVSAALREAVQACSVDEAFDRAVGDIRTALQPGVDYALSMLPFLSRLPAMTGTQVAIEILFRFHNQPDRSRFALMNAITSVARDTRDPEAKWRLEELGGGVLALRPPTDRFASPHSRLDQRTQCDFESGNPQEAIVEEFYWSPEVISGK